jgi:hypothetical protein
MIAPADNKELFRREYDDLRLIKLVRQLNPQSTLREIDNEKPTTYTRNRLRNKRESSK